MRFIDFPFSSHLPSFIGHEEVLRYLESYTEHFDLYRYIRFNVEVEEVKPVLLNPEGCNGRVCNGDSEPLFQDTVKWRVVAKNLLSGETTCEDYDRVIICSGHYSDGYIPDVPGLDAYSGHVIHSHTYRKPEDYRDQHVLIIGSGPSGLDIVLDLSPHCSHAFISNRGAPIVAPLPDNVEEVAGILRGREGKLVELADGRVLEVDTVIFATGYHFNFPFLDKECGLEWDETRIKPLYKHTFNSLHPSMVFVGIHMKINPFPFFDYQVQWIKAVWCSEKVLPMEEDMRKDGEEWYLENLKKGISSRKAAHFMGPMQWEFLEELGDEEPLDPVYQAIYEEVYRERKVNLIGYKELNYKVLSNKEFEIIRPKNQ